MAKKTRTGKTAAAGSILDKYGKLKRVPVHPSDGILRFQ
jgi:hypothetical protein